MSLSTDKIIAIGLIIALFAAIIAMVMGTDMSGIARDIVVGLIGYIGRTAVDTKKDKKEDEINAGIH